MTTIAILPTAYARLTMAGEESGELERDDIGMRKIIE